MVRCALIFKRSRAFGRIDLHPAHRVDNFAAHSAFSFADVMMLRLQLHWVLKSYVLRICILEVRRLRGAERSFFQCSLFHDHKKYGH
jgi:hypothetical protein